MIICEEQVTKFIQLLVSEEQSSTRQLLPGDVISYCFVLLRSVRVASTGHKNLVPHNVVFTTASKTRSKRYNLIAGGSAASSLSHDDSVTKKERPAV